MNTKEATGDLIVRYRDNERKLTQSRESFEKIKEQVSNLNQMLQQQSDNVEVFDAHFQAGFGGITVPRNIMESLAATLGDLRGVLDQKRRMENCLREQDLAMFIQDSSRDASEV